MPDFLEAWLTGLSNEQAKEIWDWLDSEPDAVDEMITQVCDTHREMEA